MTSPKMSWKKVLLASVLPFSIAVEEGPTTLPGQMDLPPNVTCEVGAAKLPAVVMVPGTGKFDRDVNFGNSGTDKDRIFKDLSETFTQMGIVSVRFDLRKGMTPESVRSDIKRVFDYALKIPCIDPDRVIVFAHSEGTIHVARLIAKKEITPKALVFMGMVAESPLSLVRWQAVDRSAGDILKLAVAPDRVTFEELKRAGYDRFGIPPKGYWTQEEILQKLEKEYEAARAKALAEPDDGLHDDFWSNRWWKMWWSDGARVLDDLMGFPGEIVAHHGAADTKVSATRQFQLMRAEGAKFKTPPKLVLHPGKGHSLGLDGLVGPISEDSKALVMKDVARLLNLPPPAIEGPPELSEEEMSQRPYLGLNFVLSELPKNSRFQSAYGLRVLSAVPTFPAWEAGIRPGDILIGMNGEEIGAQPKEKALFHFIRRVQGLEVGKTATLTVLRWKPSTYLPPWQRTFDVLEIQVFARTPRQPSKDLHPEWTGNPTDEEKLAEGLTRAYRIEQEYADLKKRLADMTARPDLFRRAEVDFVQHHPFLIRKAVGALLDQVRQGSFLSVARGLLKPGFDPSPSPPLKTGLPASEHLAQIRGLLAEVDGLWKEAFRNLSPEEIDFLRRHREGLVKKFEEFNYLYEDPDKERLEKNYQLISLAAKVDLDPLMRGAISLSRLADPSYLNGLKEDLTRSGLNLLQPEVLSESTPFGSILIAGTGNNWHNAAGNIAVLIDLGGNDVYADRIGSSTDKIRASIVVDLEGDDAYESSVDGGIASGEMGIGLIADFAGSDSYVGLRSTQGAAFLGVGLLFDRAGDDVYRAHSYAQGCAFFGAAALIDLGGDDRYESHLYSQGTGIAGGIGALIDVAGDDHYFAKGYFPSGYGTPGTFQGWSQGIGIGLRFLASGGIGLLHDGGGRDTMEGGDFSQGGGYYFGWGILSAEGDEGDRYIGSRYAQGFSAHSALGTFLESGGDDFYDSRNGVSTGLANDLSLTWFEDRGGQDRYPAKTFSLGTSGNNGICIFQNIGGPDRFEGPLEPANGQSNEYHGGISFSLVFGIPTKEPAKSAGEFTFLR